MGTTMDILEKKETKMDLTHEEFEVLTDLFAEMQLSCEEEQKELQDYLSISIEENAYEQ